MIMLKEDRENVVDVTDTLTVRIRDEGKSATWDPRCSADSAVETIKLAIGRAHERLYSLQRCLDAVRASGGCTVYHFVVDDVEYDSLEPIISAMQLRMLVKAQWRKGPAYIVDQLHKKWRDDARLRSAMRQTDGPDRDDLCRDMRGPINPSVGDAESIDLTERPEFFFLPRHGF